MPVIPEFTILPRNQTVVVGSHVVLTCAADGFPLPRVSWLFNGGRLPPSHNVTNGKLSFSAVSNNGSFEGNYTCIASSRAGANSRTVWLSVDGECSSIVRLDMEYLVSLLVYKFLCVVSRENKESERDGHHRICGRQRKQEYNTFVLRSSRSGEKRIVFP